MSVDATRKPDAIKVRFATVPGAHSRDRITYLSNLCEPLLGTRPAILNQTEFYFVSTDTEQTLNFPWQHPRSGQPRYEWVRKSADLSYGFLVEGANVGTQDAHAAILDGHVDRYKAMLKRGVITQEEFDKMVARTAQSKEALGD